ncbi:hypothetical protein C8R47DRAFT_198817 [Mycena vitilis]|nr:hypothetical protein C8R47DRAFT_198817 [Mycena vitilis]
MKMAFLVAFTSYLARAGLHRLGALNAPVPTCLKGNWLFFLLALKSSRLEEYWGRITLFSGWMHHLWSHPFRS